MTKRALARKALRLRGTRAGDIYARRVLAAGWEEEAVRELTEQLKLDPDSIEMKPGSSSNSITVTAEGANNGESEWLIFKNEAEAEEYALEYVSDMLNDEPSLFNQDWLTRHLYVTPTDRRVIAAEEADAYIGDLSDEEILEMAGQEGFIENAEDQVLVLEEQKSELEAQMAEAQAQANDQEYDLLAEQLSALQQEINDLEQQREPMVEMARERLMEQYAERVEQQLARDPVGYAEDLGFSLGDKRPPWLSLNIKEAALDAIRTDGVAHFLDPYDGEEVELSSGAVAYGTN